MMVVLQQVIAATSISRLSLGYSLGKLLLITGEVKIIFLLYKVGLH